MTNLKTNFIALIALLTFTLISLNATAQLHVVKPDGNVGIGTDTPIEKLEVDGQANIKGIKGEGTRRNTAYLSIGRYNPLSSTRPDKIGSAGVVLYAPEYDSESANDILSHKKALTGFSATKGEVSSFTHNGKGHFQLRCWDPASEIRFITKSGPGQGPQQKMVIKPGLGYVGIGTSNPTAKLDVNGGIKAVNGYKPGGGDWTVLSDKRTKKNINKYTKGLKDVLKLNPVMFNYNGKAGVSDTKTTYIGLIAQEFAEIEPNAVSKYVHTDTISKKTEEYMAMDASSIRYMLVNAVKELQSIIELQRAEIVDLKENLAKINTVGAATINPTANEISVLLEGNGIESALLTQNMPNPFTTTTRIEYFIPENSRNARMSFRDMTGKEIKRVDITEEGIGAIELTAKDLATGIYSYVLYTNGNIVNSKKMIVK